VLGLSFPLLSDDEVLELKALEALDAPNVKSFTVAG